MSHDKAILSSEVFVWILKVMLHKKLGDHQERVGNNIQVMSESEAEIHQSMQLCKAELGSSATSFSFQFQMCQAKLLLFHKLIVIHSFPVSLRSSAVGWGQPHFLWALKHLQIKVPN